MRLASIPKWQGDKSGRLLALANCKGLLIALGIMGAWLCHLGMLLSLGVSSVHPFGLVGVILLQTFLNTGLFITVHDAIHGLVYPANRTVNTVLGALCAIAYAFLPYKTLLTKHWLHHRYPMSEVDPDFQGTGKAGFWGWYVRFMGQYWGWKPLIRLASAVGMVSFVFRLSPLNLILFWGIPLLLSSLQLFYFGTYWPHQNIEQGCYPCARSYPLPWVLSLLACYHLGYHHEHHEHPEIPWWQLPSLYETQSGV
ncbi:MAG: fatty acid desaturase [Cyanobacteria bacterium P01_G01_bin.38]